MASKVSAKTAPEHIVSDDIITKYKLAGEIAKKALTQGVSLCVVDAKIADICSAVDAFIVDEAKKEYPTDKVMLKGLSLPTSVSVNDILGNFSPLANDTTVLQDGDTVKIDLGVTIDGYVIQVAQTVTIGGAAVTPLVIAAYTAAVVSAKLIKAGNTNEQVTEAISAIAAEYKVTPVIGVLSHNITRFNCTGEKVICQGEEPDRKAHKVTFEKGEAYVLDIVFADSEGKSTVFGDKPFIYRRDPSKKVTAKTKAGQQLLQTVDKQYPCFPFSLRTIATTNKTYSLGLAELFKTGIFEAYPVMQIKGAKVAQVKLTVLLMQDGTSKIVSGDLSVAPVKSEKYAEVLNGDALVQL